MLDEAVIVVGGGASGLSAAAALKRRGIDALVLEQDAAIGGSWARRYDRLDLHTIRELSGLAHFPIPRRYPTCLSRDDVVGYLNEYAQRLGVRMVTGRIVQRIRREDTSGARWIVETAGGDWCARVAIIATEQYRKPFVPAWPGRESYSGRLTHSADYSNSRPTVRPSAWRGM